MHKNLIDNLVVTCDEIEDTSKSVVINPSNGRHYWLIAVALLAITYLLLLVAIVVKFCMKCDVRIPRLFWYYCGSKKPKIFWLLLFWWHDE